MSLKFSTFHDDELRRAGGWLSLIRKEKEAVVRRRDFFFSCQQSQPSLSSQQKTEQHKRATQSELLQNLFN